MKLNLTEVKKFTKLVEKSLKQIQKTTNEGTIVNSRLRKTVISKQTTLYFRIVDNASTTEILLFWNNQKDPDSLKKILRKFAL